MPKFNFNFDFIPVPTDFIETHMPSANGAYVKVYLMALSLGFSDKEMTTAEIAARLNLLESDVVNALKYWKDNGVLQYSDDDTAAFASGKKTAKQDNIPEKKNIQYITEAMTDNKDLAELCALSQEILGKTLNNSEIETLYWIYDELGLSAEVITMLLEYCVSKDKRNMKYIEKVAISWHENGIITINAADKFISSEKEKSGYFYSLRKLLEIGERNLTKSEEVYLKTWRDTYGMDENMVGLAYEYCIMQINKKSYAYMDSILKRWNELGIHTVPQAEKDHEDFKNKYKQNNLDVFSEDNFDYDELEKIIRDNQ